jgi:hypothetical protein
MNSKGFRGSVSSTLERDGKIAVPPVSYNSKLPYVYGVLSHSWICPHRPQIPVHYMLVTTFVVGRFLYFRNYCKDRSSERIPVPHLFTRTGAIITPDVIRTTDRTHNILSPVPVCFESCLLRVALPFIVPLLQKLIGLITYERMELYCLSRTLFMVPHKISKHYETF